MGTLEDRIALSDGVSPALERMIKAAERTAAKFELAGNIADRFNRSLRFPQAADAVSRINTEATETVVSIMNMNTAANFLPPTVHRATEHVEHLNERMRESRGILGGVKEALSSTFAQFTMASLAADAIGRMVSAITQAPGRLAVLSDEYSGITARLNLVMGNQAQAAALNDQIYYSALRARGGYAEMADAVSKIAMTAREAFPDPREVVPFMEGIQKLFTIGGTDVVRQKDALLQLTQALGSGRLQGDEFRSIAEAAPLIEQMVAKQMNVPIGALKELSSKGEITAQIMKNAILGSLDEINEKFSLIPLKWQDAWQNIKTVAFREFVPVFEQLSRLANSPVMQQIGMGMIGGIKLAAAAVLGMMNNIEWLAGIAQNVGAYIGGWLSAGFTILAPVFETLAALALSFFIVYAAGWVTAQMPLLAHIALLGVKAMWDAILIGYAWAQNAAIVAQNATLLIASARMGMVTMATAAWALVTQGVTAALRLLNLTMFMSPIGIVIALVGAVIVAFGAWAIKTKGLRNTIAEVFGSIAEIAGHAVNFMIRRINGLIDIINKAAEGLNGLFGTKIGTVETIGEVDPKAWGKGASDWAKNFDIHNYFPNFNPEMPDPDDYKGKGFPGLDALVNPSKDTAKNTQAIKEAMEITDEDLKYLRDAAEREAVNKYTTAEVKIDMGGIQNNVSSDIDLDGMVRYVSDSLFDAMAAGANKVHI